MKRPLLLIIAICLAQTSCGPSAELQTLNERKRLTQPLFEISNGTDGDKRMRRLAKAESDRLKHSSTASPNLVAFRIHPGRGRYIISAYWIGLENLADGFEIKFQDGTDIIVPFSKDNSGTSDYVLYSAKVFSERHKDILDPERPELVSGITLTQAGEKCSNTIAITTAKPNTTIWTDAVGANVNDDLELWGFR